MTELQTKANMSNLQKAWAKNKEKQQNIKEVKMSDKTTPKDVGIKPEKLLVVLEENTPIADSQLPITDPKPTNPVNTTPKVKKSIYEKYSKYVYDLCKDVFYYILYAIVFYVGGLYLESARKYYQSSDKRNHSNDTINHNEQITIEKKGGPSNGDRSINSEQLHRNDHLFSSNSSNNLFQ